MANQAQARQSRQQELTNDERQAHSFLHSTAELMAGNEELAVFRRFDHLNLLNLLTMQHEIERLAMEFQKYAPGREPEYGIADPPWYALPQQNIRGVQSVEEKETIQKLHIERMRVWADLSPKLGEYNRALAEVAGLRSLDVPTGKDIEKLRTKLEGLRVTKQLPPDVGQTWDSKYDDDLLSVRIAGEKGRKTSSWIKLFIGILKWELIGRRRATTTSVAPGEPREIIVGKKREPISRAEIARKHAFASRLIMALFGGIALIVPTVIMAKVEGINVSLITTSVAVLIFGFVLAVGATDSTGKDVLAATAAYTAVLVVFVGTSLQGGGGSAADSANVSNATSTAAP